MSEILKEILKELKHQTQLMTYLYERKDEKSTNMNELYAQAKKANEMILNQPGMADSDIGKLLSTAMTAMMKKGG